MSCCGKSKFVKYVWALLGLTVLAAMIFSLVSCGRKEPTSSPQVSDVSTEEEILYYTCGMHPSVRVSPTEYEKGKTNCPICNMNLTPVYKKDAAAEELYYGCGMEGAEHVFQIKSVKPDMTCPICGMLLKKLSKEEADRLKGVVGRVKIEGEQMRLAGVRTEPVKKHHLFKEIRTVGKIAYDPQLAIAQEEFISTLKTLDKVQEGTIPEIKERTLSLVESSRRKLKLLGLGDEQIKELEEEREIQTSLILPEEKMWVYGEAYEYELSWVKAGEKVKVTTSSLPGEEFKGIISSVDPVVDPKTRSVTFRVQVDNPDLKLKPDMYVDVTIMSMYMSPDGEHMVLAIPREAVLDTGRRKLVWIDAGGGEFQGREVKLGPEASAEIDGKTQRYFPILKGINEGELVVIRGNFLIDSQSQLTGGAAGAYGGALESEEGSAPPSTHQH